MELIIVIFFFALTSAVCMQVFVRANEIARDTKSTNLAILWADNACECFYEFGSDREKIEETLDSAFDRNSGYAYSLDFTEDRSFDYMTFTFLDVQKEREIYSFTFKTHKKEAAK